MEHKIYESANILSLKNCLAEIHLSEEFFNSEECKENFNQDLSCKNNIYECLFEGCGKKFGKPSRLAQHKRIHTGEKPYRCYFEGCIQSYARNQHLTRHIKTAHCIGDQPKEIKCEDCEKIFKSEFNLKKHFHRYHVRNLYECSECNLTFKKLQYLKAHEFIHTGIKQFRCMHPGCKKSFPSSSKLRRHSFCHVPERYSCSECSKKFDKFNLVLQHTREDHPKVCDICGRYFTQAKHLRHHMKKHEQGLVLYNCPAIGCNKFYTAERNLATHIKLKHSSTSPENVCDICKAVLSTKQKLTEHKMKIHSTESRPVRKVSINRKPRKDKGISRTDLPALLSGYVPSNKGII